MKQPAILALEDGSLFKGISVGSDGVTVGEVVFNTAMTGYQEILTDPSYAKQIITLTYPQIGNVGTNQADAESERVWAAGLVIREMSLLDSNWRSELPLDLYLKKHSIIAIAEIDTRRLTRLLRKKGSLNGCIMAGSLDTEQAMRYAQGFPGLEGMDLAQAVTTLSTYTYRIGTWQWPAGYRQYSAEELPWHVVVYDFGVKRTILRMLVDRGCRLTIVPATTPIEEVLAMDPDGLFLSNGPGDPAACHYAIDAIYKMQSFEARPLLGICLGHQLLALGCGAKTTKLKFGHHGANHPVFNELTSQVYITSQNHGFAVETNSLPSQLAVTSRSLFDGTLQGIKHRKKPWIGFQGHPEASPGPHDVQVFFDEFVAMIKSYKEETYAEAK